MKFDILNKPAYVYAIENEELGLIYIGIHEGIFEEDTAYMGSSDYLDEIRKEFSEFTFVKHLLGVYKSEVAAKEEETALIMHLRNTEPEALLNRSANDKMHQWEPLGYGNLNAEQKVRLDKVKKTVRSRSVMNDAQYKCLIMVKKEDGTAHAPCMPNRNLTPIPQYGRWPKEMLELYAELPAGFWHFATILDTKPNWKGEVKHNYNIQTLVEEFSSEEEARVQSSKYSGMSQDDYKTFLVNSKII